MTITPYNLAYISLFYVMFSRLITAAGVPKLADHLHFLLVFLALLILALKCKPSGGNKKIIYGLAVLFGCVVISASLNGAGIVNIILSYLLLTQPFFLFLIMTWRKWTLMEVHGFKRLLLLIAISHIILSYFQALLLGLSGDFVRGLFIGMGAGGHVAGAVALSAAVFFIFGDTEKSGKLAKSALAFVLATIVVMSDSKQVLAVFFISMVVFSISRLSQLRSFSMSIALACLTYILLVVLSNTFIPGTRILGNTDFFVQGLQQKLNVVPVIIHHYDSPLNWLFGLGPGHTVGRLGSMLPDYSEYLAPLGATISNATRAVWFAQQNHYLSNSISGSSLFSLFFSWAGVWGDLGVLGLAVYAYTLVALYRRVRSDSFSSFLLITLVVFGFVFSWMEEPSYTLFIISILGLRWQHLRRESLAPIKILKQSI